MLAVRPCGPVRLPPLVLDDSVKITPTTEAVLLLTSSLGKRGIEELKPLTPSEWGEFAAWMKDQSLSPGDLLQCDLGDSLKMWEHPKVTTSRVEGLLNRGAALGFALEKWERAGLWVVTRADANYPSQLKQHLGRSAPATLFGCGNVELLNIRGIAVVGSRDADTNDLCFAERVGRRAAECGELLVSGGAAGVDRAAMFGALDADGAVTGVLAEKLLRATTSSEYRSHLLTGNLTLVSPFDPEASFTVGNAMARNRYIYCLAHDAIVVSSKQGRGGTWRGATENLKHGWVPLLVAMSDAANSGNSGLVELGGHWLENLDGEPFSGRAQGVNVGQASESRANVRLESTEAEQKEPTTFVSQTAESVDKNISIEKRTDEKNIDIEEFPVAAKEDPAEDLFEMARSLISALCIEPKPAIDIANALGVTKPTADLWIKRLVIERELKKVRNPVRYVTCEKDLLEVR